jgi:RNA polymerase sigma-70 factor (ECF subfamily)
VVENEINASPSACGPLSPAVSMRPTAADPALPADHFRWFTDEVHAHDRQLRAYLRASFPAVRDLDDVVQDSYLRIWKARAAHPIRSAKAFLFTIARRLAIKRVQKNRAAPLDAVGDLAELRVIADEPNPAEALGYREKVALLAEALAMLPARCREIVILRKLHCLPQREVAAQLGLSERTVENQLARGVKRCEQFFRQRGADRLY